jgi:hypothetical protein
MQPEGLGKLMNPLPSERMQKDSSERQIMTFETSSIRSPEEESLLLFNFVRFMDWSSEGLKFPLVRLGPVIVTPYQTV